MSITGNLQTMQLSEVLQWLGHTAKTGALVLSNGSVEKRIIFLRGEVVMTASTERVSCNSNNSTSPPGGYSGSQRWNSRVLAS